MTPQEEAIFEAKAEKMLRGHRGCPLGRDFRAFRYRYDVSPLDEDFASRYDQTFPGAPSSPEWWERKYGRLNG